MSTDESTIVGTREVQLNNGSFKATIPKSEALDLGIDEDSAVVWERDPDGSLRLTPT